MADAITSDLLDLCPDTVVNEPWLSSDSEGGDNYGTVRSLPARVTGKMQVVQGTDGVEHVSSVHVLFPGVFGVTAKDRFTLPVRFSTNPNLTDADEALKARQPVCIAVTQATDENGPHHEKAYF